MTDNNPHTADKKLHESLLSAGYQQFTGDLLDLAQVASCPEFVYKRVKNIAHKQMALQQGIVQFAPLAYYQRAEHSPARKDENEGNMKLGKTSLWLPCIYVEWLQDNYEIELIPHKTREFASNALHCTPGGELALVKVAAIEGLSYSSLAFCCSVSKDLPKNIEQDFGEFVYKIHVKSFVENLIPINSYGRSPLFTDAKTGEKLPVEKLSPLIDACKVVYLPSGDNRIVEPSEFFNRAVKECYAAFRREDLIKAICMANPQFSFIPDAELNYAMSYGSSLYAFASGALSTGFLKDENFSSQKEFRFLIDFVKGASSVYVRKSVEKMQEETFVSAELYPPQDPLLFRIKNPTEVFFDA